MKVTTISYCGRTFEVWYDNSAGVRTWYGREIDPASGFQIGEAFDHSSRDMVLVEVGMRVAK